MRFVAAFTVSTTMLWGAFSALAGDRCDASSGVLLSAGNDAPWDIRVLVNPEEIPLNVPFDATVTVCSGRETPPAQVAIDAIMPEHNHGMNYKPELILINDYRYEVRSLVFHMPGIWRIDVTAYEGQTAHRYSYEMPLQ